MPERNVVQTITAALDVTPTGDLYSFLRKRRCELFWIEGHIYMIKLPEGTYKEPVEGTHHSFVIYFPDGCTVKEKPYRPGCSALRWNNNKGDGMYGP